MANYTFTLKKDDIFVEFTTTDKDMMNEQFGLWVTDATEYAKTHPSVEKKNLEAVDRQKRYEARRQERLEKEAQRKAELEKKQREADEKAALLQEKALKEQEEKAKQQQENLQQNNSANEAEVAPTEPVTINSLQAKVEAPTTQAQVQPQTQAQTAPDFDKLLEQKLANSTFAPNELKDERFVEFFNSKNHETKLQHLVIAAFYLLQFEKIERFSLKQINSKLMHNISEVIDHSVLQDAMNSGIIEVYPDLTGTSEIREYRLTEKGEDFFINGLQ